MIKFVDTPNALSWSNYIFAFSIRSINLNSLTQNAFDEGPLNVTYHTISRSFPHSINIWVSVFANSRISLFPAIVLHVICRSSAYTDATSNIDCSPHGYFVDKSIFSAKCPVCTSATALGTVLILSTNSSMNRFYKLRLNNETCRTSLATEIHVFCVFQYLLSTTRIKMVLSFDIFFWTELATFVPINVF